MTLPNFLVVGAMKAGTTSVHQYLDAHPQIFMSRNKELHYFVGGLPRSHRRDGGWEKGRDWYEEQFAEAGAAVAIGESSPSYTAYPLRQGVPARIAASIPHARFIYLLRHPVDRARSEYVHKWSNGVERRPIARALLDDPMYLDKSRYAAQIEQYLGYFPLERILLVLSEDLRRDRASAMARIWEFLGVRCLEDDGILATEFHRSAEKEPVSTLRRLARRLPGYADVALRSPHLVHRAFGSVARARHDPRSLTVPDDVRREMEDRLRPDLERLEGLVPTARQRWGL